MHWGERQEYALDRPSIYRRAHSPFTHTLIPMGNLESPNS
uniref:Uncharacterized protein n=1 Tax=Anguilla anguilla TaxID=7936 RepID=A0A0E9VRZ4_ANGAN